MKPTAMPFPNRLSRVAAATVFAGLTLAACDRQPTPTTEAASAPASTAASAVAPASSAKASVFKPFDFELAGSVPNAKDGTEVRLVPFYSFTGEQKTGKGKVLAKGVVTNGQIDIKGTSAYPQPVFIFVGDREFADGSFMVQEGRLDLVAGNESNLGISNSRYGKLMEARRSPEFKALRAEEDKLQADMDSGRYKGKALKEIERKLSSVAGKIYELGILEEVPFILDTTADPFERLIVLDRNVDEETLTFQKRLDLLDELEQKLGPHPIIAGQRQMQQNQLANLHTQDSVVTGAQFKEVLGKDINGKEVKLSDMVKANKVVLLDIWASWCGACREEFPHLKQVYAKYRSKGFEVFAISTDERQKDWIKAMAEDKTTDSWPQLHDGRGESANVAMDYGVNSYPSKFLITQDGKIAANSNHEKVDLDVMLPKLLK